MKSKDIGLIAMFAALTCAMGLAPSILLPLVGITVAIQTLGMLLAGGILGAKRGALAMFLVIGLVAIGLPVLTGAQGGLHKLVGPTAGFIWTWPLGGFLVGLLIERWWEKLTYLKTFLACLLASVSLYVLGQTWLAISTQLPLSTAVWSWVFYLPADILKCVVAAFVIVTVKRAYPLINPRRHD